jgi:hypothetical protein
MVRQFRTACNLHWRELLSSDEIRNWVNRQQVPKRLSTELGHPGVYRFIFAEARDGNSAHTPCYVGEAGKIGMRLLHHFRQEGQTADQLGAQGTRRLRAGWYVRGSIRNSGGDFKLQVLSVEGPVNFCGLTFGPDTIPNPFENSFLRRMLENWAIVASEYVDGLQPLNRRGTPHILRDILKEARKNHRRE